MKQEGCVLQQLSDAQPVKPNMQITTGTINLPCFDLKERTSLILGLTSLINSQEAQANKLYNVQPIR